MICINYKIFFLYKYKSILKLIIIYFFIRNPLLHKESPFLKEDVKTLNNNALIDLNRQNRLFKNNMLFIIPSWGDLIGNPTLGKYANQNVAKIHTDIVIFFGGVECSIQTEKGTLYCIFGLGYYYNKFELVHGVELQRGKYIIDEKILTGLVLSDFVYDQMATSRNITLENDRDVIIAEKVVKVPINLSLRTETQRTFIKGALMRNVFIPYKDIVLRMLDIINEPEMYTLDGHFLLNAHSDYFNKILVSERIKSFLYGGYMNSTAGISEIAYGADLLLNHILTPMEMQEIQGIILNLKNIYSALNFDPSYFYSLLENASKMLKSETPQFISQVGTISNSFTNKNSVLYSAENRINSFIEWPREYPRYNKEQIEIKPPIEQPILQPGVRIMGSSSQASIPEKIETYVPPVEQEKFTLRIDKSEKVEIKPIPPPPMGNIEEILLYLRRIIEENYEMRAIGTVFGLARDALKKIVLHSDYLWEMSKIANIYQKKEAYYGLSPRNKNDLLEKLDNWIQDNREKERVEQEKMEQERLEQERLVRERSEKARLKRIEQQQEVKRLAKEKDMEEQQILEQQLYEQQMREQHLWEQQLREQQLYEQQMPQHQMPQHQMPQHQMPQQQMPQQQMPQQQIPEQGMLPPIGMQKSCVESLPVPLKMNIKQQEGFAPDQKLRNKLEQRRLKQEKKMEKKKQKLAKKKAKKIKK